MRLLRAVLPRPFDALDRRARCPPSKAPFSADAIVFTILG